jgi:hypothetical protein
VLPNQLGKVKAHQYSVAFYPQVSFTYTFTRLPCARDKAEISESG